MKTEKPCQIMANGAAKTNVNGPPACARSLPIKVSKTSPA
ncbi:Uncharacterised protein [Chlamydia trachomatis]|nr:Uncharacterised protein [Chlamydia trachomatis]